VLKSDRAVALHVSRALKRNEMVGIIIDVSFNERNAEVDFLGGRVQFGAGPAHLARATGAPILPFYVYRPERWHPQVVEIGPPIYASDDPVATMQQCVSSPEERTRQYPADWLARMDPNRPLTGQWND